MFVTAVYARAACDHSGAVLSVYVIFLEVAVECLPPFLPLYIKTCCGFRSSAHLASSYRQQLPINCVQYFQFLVQKFIYFS